MSNSLLMQAVLTSWEKCISNEISFNSYNHIKYLNEDELKNKIHKNRHFISIFERAVNQIELLIDKEKYAILLTDKNGFLLKIKAENSLEEIINNSFIQIGIQFNENTVGTNAISMSEQLKKPVYFLPKYHYNNIFKKFIFYAVPINIKNEVYGYISAVSIGKILSKKTCIVLDYMSLNIANEYLKVLKNPKKNIVINNKYKKILISLAKGLTDKAIALNMNMNFATYKYHKRNLFKIIEAECRTEAVIKALKLNIISLEEFE